MSVAIAVEAGEHVRSGKTQFCKKQKEIEFNLIKEAKKRINFYYGDHNVHAFWMRILHSWSFEELAQQACIGSRGRHAATATANSLASLPFRL